MSFKDIELPDNLIDALNKQNITSPTKIQAKTYKHIVNDRDIIGISSTGTGKTLAYLLPIMTNVVTGNNIQAIILVPTQELAVQIDKQITTLIENANLSIRALFLIGEVNIKRQIESLKQKKPNIIIGTPAKILQLIQMKKLKVHTVKTLVLDEFDKLNNKSYIDSVLSIRKSLMKRTQILLFSASIDKKSLNFANSFLYKPIYINVENNNKSIPTSIKHYYIISDRRERIETLRKVVKALNSDKTIIFINSKYDLQETLQKLQYHHYNVGAIAGNYNKFDKKNSLDDFKKGNINYLLATDIAARGLQIDNVSTIINLNLPEDSNDYLHRAGRCGRNGNQGICISIITENELSKIKKLRKDLNINIIQKKLYQGRLVAK